MDHRPTLPELPSLEPGVVLLDAADTRGALHALVADHLLLEGTSAYWIDSHGFASTRPLTDIAPSERLLDRIEVARGFTPQQHHSLAQTLFAERAIDPGLIVAPAVDGQYRDDDCHGDEPTQLLVRTLAKLAGLARRHECPVLVTRTRDDAFAAPVAACATDRIECVSTPMGPRFVSGEFETLVYPEGDGWVQTTLAFWAEVLSARRPLYQRSRPITPEMIHGAN